MVCLGGASGVDIFALVLPTESEQMYPWEKQSRENKADYEAFCRYREAAAEPDLHSLAAEMRRDESGIAELAAIRNWSERRRKFREYILRMTPKEAKPACGRIAPTDTNSRNLLEQIIAIVNTRIDETKSEMAEWGIDELIKFTSLYSKTMLEASKFLSAEQSDKNDRSEQMPAESGSEETIEKARELLAMIDSSARICPEDSPRDE